MRNLLFLIICCFFVLTNALFAQWDVSYWHRNAMGAKSEIPWVTRIDPKSFGTIDVRYNYDWNRSGGVYFGKAFKIKDTGWTFVPEVGTIIGEYDGFGPELLLIGSHGKWSHFSQWQWVSSFNTNKNPDWGYIWIEELRKTPIPHTEIGIGAQTFYLRGDSRPQTDLGIATRFTFGKLYIKIWPTWGIQKNKRKPTNYIGIGYAW